MMPNDPTLLHAYALLRTVELQRRATQERRARHAADHEPQLERVSYLRRTVGAALVRAGERLQGAHRPVAADPQPLTGHLRVVR